MVVDFIEEYVKLIVSHKEDIKVQLKDIDKNQKEIIILAHINDIGKLIGKGGNMINSLKTIIIGCEIKNNISYKIQIQEHK
jgi:predicted RNA-binding protein YlqC (UPF0109 family)